MISLQQLAEMFEQSMSSWISDPNIGIKIWASAGEYSESIRTGNTVQAYIQGTLRTSSSSNAANILSMGYNGLTLDLSIPLQRPKTLSTQTEEALQKINDSQYPFLTYMLSAIDNYFNNSIYAIQNITDSRGTEYTVTFLAGRTITGNVDIAAQYGNNLIATVLIGLSFLEGGICARNIVLEIDTVRVPFSNVNINRAKQKSSDVYSGNTSIKNLASASAISIDFAFPANSDNTTEQAFQSILESNTNTAHFVNIEIGSAYDGQYLMMFDNINVAGQGVQFAGISGALIECVDNPVYLTVPDYMQVGYFNIPNSSLSIINSVTYTATRVYPRGGYQYPQITIPVYIAGKTLNITLNLTSSTTNSDGSSTCSYTSSSAGVLIDPAFLVYNSLSKSYRYFVISLGQISATANRVTFSIAKGASGNVS